MNKNITLTEAVELLEGYGYTITGGHFDTLADFISYHIRHSAPELRAGIVPRFLADDLGALIGVELDDPREVAAYLDSLTA